jgi:hypothetical protein
MSVDTLHAQCTMLVFLYTLTLNSVNKQRWSFNTYCSAVGDSPAQLRIVVFYFILVD